eukprot:9042888-Pyramimonas_sp.AAC.1
MLLESWLCLSAVPWRAFFLPLPHNRPVTSVEGVHTPARVFPICSASPRCRICSCSTLGLACAIPSGGSGALGVL